MDEKQLFDLVQKIAVMAYDYATPVPAQGGLWLEDNRAAVIVPSHFQTSSGLFLELYYRIPGKIWTPWGVWSCWGSGVGWDNETMSKFLARLGAVEYMTLTLSSLGEFGPVYALTSVDGVPLPPAIERPRDKYMKYEDAMAAWEALNAIK